MVTFFSKKVTDKSKFEKQTEMKNYVITIIIIGVIGSLITLLAPDGEGGGLKKHVSLAVGLCMILCLSSPLISLIQGLRELDMHSLAPETGDVNKDEYESIFESSLEGAEAQYIREGIAAILKDRFDIEPSECSVSVKFSSDKAGKRVLDRIFVRLYGSAIWKDTEEIEDYLTELFSCDVITAVG